jgi:hypothetical protein
MTVCLSFKENWQEGHKISQQLDGIISSNDLVKKLEITVLDPQEGREKIITDLPLSFAKGIIRVVDTSDLRLTTKWIL